MVSHDSSKQSMASFPLHPTCKVTQTINRIRAAFSVVLRAASQSLRLNRVLHRTSLHAPVCVPSADSASILISITRSVRHNGLPSSSNTQRDYAELLLRRALLLFSEMYTLRNSAKQSMASVLLQHANKFISARPRQSCSPLHRVKGKPAS